jgi:hypothetical protein
MKHTTKDETRQNDYPNNVASNRDRVFHPGGLQEMNTSELAKLIGRQATLSGRRNEFATSVRILDAKQVYGVTRYQVEPLQGSGSVWVNAERITLSPEVKQ